MLSAFDCRKLGHPWGKKDPAGSNHHEYLTTVTTKEDVQMRNRREFAILET